jgi:iron complex outermembrane receptor protein
MSCLLDSGASAAQALPSQLDPVTVTARKRIEPYLAVPLAIDVRQRERLIEASVGDLSSLSRTAPGLYFESLWGGAGSAPVLRGQAQPNAAGDNVGVFVDGVYQAERTAIDAALLDVERIEVVRGPQSALFGRSTFAGAIHYVPRAPTREFSGGVELGGGTDGYASATAHLSGPLQGESLLGRLAVGTRRAEGTWGNAGGAAHSGGYERDALAMTLAFADDGPWNAELSGRWFKTESEHPAQVFIGGADYDCGAIDALSGYWSYYCGRLPDAGPVSLSPAMPDSTNEASQASLVVTWSSDRMTFESHSSYYRGSSDIIRDFDSSRTGESFGVCTRQVNCPQPGMLAMPLNGLVSVNSVSRMRPETTEWSQEFRLHGTVAGQYEWLVGVTGFMTDADSKASFGFERGSLAPDEALTVLLPLTPDIAGPLARGNSALVADPNREQVIQAESRTEVETLAAFGALTYRPTQRLALRAEWRTSREETSIDNITANFVPSFGDAIPEQSFTDTTPRLSVDYAPVPHALLYVSAAKGSRSGGINLIPGLLPEEQSYGPEYNWTYEVSGRYEDPSGRWRGGMTLYRIDWRDTQINGFSNTPGIANLITRNTAGVETDGIEVSLEAQVHPRLALHGAYSRTDPEFVSGSDDPGSSAFCGLRGGNRESSFCTVGPPRSGLAPPGVWVPYVDGNVLQRAPRTQWIVGLRSESPDFSQGWTAIAALDLSYQSDVYDRAINGAYYGDRSLLTGRIGISRGPLALEIWGTNLTDERYVRAASSRGATFYPVAPRPLDLVLGEGRRLGISVRYEL